jgi:hypothetical protein
MAHRGRNMWVRNSNKYSQKILLQLTAPPKMTVLYNSTTLKILFIQYKSKNCSKHAVKTFNMELQLIQIKPFVLLITVINFQHYLTGSS